MKDSVASLLYGGCGWWIRYRVVISSIVVVHWNAKPTSAVEQFWVHKAEPKTQKAVLPVVISVHIIEEIFGRSS